ncbi:hemerythrin domain-containing protein [Streptomyces sp. H10-C2]|uniref:hemerythrin domain-containing protein n=1 Tax=unclassified Streptomyces TaxID=2593676 RepID=UPI0024BAE5F8|nr:MULTISPECIES: hemerythrin domain-containing protein [unclassified Streptomyces]MDJ0343449.1 hemerythrin domain-containing protein [Streptomyces sp. PH10-H1]MDJ0371529.1 hemerythrin domain-containing protein [Streptomyces sp. H10-C2]
MMYAVHNAFERDLDRLISLADRGVVPGPAVRADWEQCTTYLHIHHTAEDTHLWPVLRAKLADRPTDLELLEEMEREHAGLDALLDALDAALTASTPPHPLLRISCWRTLNGSPTPSPNTAGMRRTRRCPW